MSTAEIESVRPSLTRASTSIRGALTYLAFGSSARRTRAEQPPFAIVDSLFLRHFAPEGRLRTWLGTKAEDSGHFVKSFRALGQAAVLWATLRVDSPYEQLGERFIRGPIYVLGRGSDPSAVHKVGFLRRLKVASG